MKELESKLKPGEHIGVVCGRYYAMDRDNRWERIESYYNALVKGIGEEAPSAHEAVEASYARDESDEFVKPFIVEPLKVEDGDSVICFNFRPDRVRQISRVLTQREFDGFKRDVLPDIYYACLTEYDASLKLPVAFDLSTMPSQDVSFTLPELLACHKIGQFHTAETEKYAHVTYFLNGGKEGEVDMEKRYLVPSLKVATYDLAPEMQTPEVCRIACQAARNESYPFVVLNFANPDMVGHTGDMAAAVKAVEIVDDAFGKLLENTRELEGTLLITADHGNVEQMLNKKTGDPHTAHTTNPVPFIVADFNPEHKLNGNFKLDNGTLADIAPSVLDIMGLEKPKVMTGKSLVKRRG